MRPSLAEKNKNKLILEISKFFNTEYVEKLARTTGFVRRDSKLQGLDFFMLCVFMHQKCPNISLNGLCEELIPKNILISKQSLQDRFNEPAVCFMKNMVGEALSKKLLTQDSLVPSCFSRIIIGDSTVFQLPSIYASKYQGSGGGASIAAVKIQYQIDLLTHAIIALCTQKGTAKDTNQPLEDHRANDLRIEDLG